MGQATSKADPYDHSVADLSAMSTAIPRDIQRNIHSLHDMDTQYSMPRDHDSSLSVVADAPEVAPKVALAGGGDPKYTPYHRMEYLWSTMGPREQAEVQQYHERNYF